MFYCLNYHFYCTIPCAVKLMLWNVYITRNLCENKNEIGNLRYFTIEINSWPLEFWLMYLKWTSRIVCIFVQLEYKLPTITDYVHVGLGNIFQEKGVLCYYGKWLHFPVAWELCDRDRYEGLFITLSYLFQRVHNHSHNVHCLVDWNLCYEDLCFCIWHVFTGNVVFPGLELRWVKTSGYETSRSTWTSWLRRIAPKVVFCAWWCASFCSETIQEPSSVFVS